MPIPKDAFRKFPAEPSARRRTGFSVFVTNISKRIHRTTLGEAFQVYDSVVDSFIAYKNIKRKGKPTTSAFVRFRRQHEARKAVTQGDGRIMDGFKIRVFLDKNFPGEKCKSTDLTTSQQRAGNALRDLRSYKEVVMGKRRPVDRSRNSMTEVDTINKKFGRQSEEVSSVAVLEAKRDDIQTIPDWVTQQKQTATWCNLVQMVWVCMTSPFLARRAARSLNECSNWWSPSQTHLGFRRSKLSWFISHLILNWGVVPLRYPKRAPLLVWARKRNLRVAKSISKGAKKRENESTSANQSILRSTNPASCLISVLPCEGVGVLSEMETTLIKRKELGIKFTASDERVLKRLHELEAEEGE
ncbi:hypothetical protein V6N12_045020 [Hibiscus sabdariffa]|uniref:RRM domain-containing protein n=1 Tax=Hibiscus sabdariffa TaxID=183260 RepID=A0ABR2G1J0_9ROSI